MEALVVVGAVDAAVVEPVGCEEGVAVLPPPNSEPAAAGAEVAVVVVGWAEEPTVPRPRNRDFAADPSLAGSEGLDPRFEKIPPAEGVELCCAPPKMLVLLLPDAGTAEVVLLVLPNSPVDGVDAD